MSAATHSSSSRASTRPSSAPRRSKPPSGRRSPPCWPTCWLSPSSSSPSSSTAATPAPAHLRWTKENRAGPYPVGTGGGDEVEVGALCLSSRPDRTNHPSLPVSSGKLHHIIEKYPGQVHQTAPLSLPRRQRENLWFAGEHAEGNEAGDGLVEGDAVEQGCRDDEDPEPFGVEEQRQNESQDERGEDDGGHDKHDERHDAAQTAVAGGGPGGAEAALHLAHTLREEDGGEVAAAQRDPDTGQPDRQRGQREIPGMGE